MYTSPTITWKTDDFNIAWEENFQVQEKNADISALQKSSNSSMFYDISNLTEVHESN